MENIILIKQKRNISEILDKTNLLMGISHIQTEINIWAI